MFNGTKSGGFNRVEGRGLTAPRPFEEIWHELCINKKAEGERRKTLEEPCGVRGNDVAGKRGKAGGY
ncbi:MAG: hypothetical protein C6W57_13060 [Caldibacillus debilis]|nr:MAG: hypothetical protein C6W57_13060 [Caldibacillus debilis]